MNPARARLGLIFGIAALALTLASPAHATEWVGCAGGRYSFDYLVSIGGSHVVDIVVLLDGEQQNLGAWKIGQQSLDVGKKTIHFSATLPPPEGRELELHASGDRGSLRLRGKDYDATFEMKCYWAL